MSNSKVAARALVMVVSLVMFGCAYNPNKEFASYDADQFSARPVLLVVDVLMMDDVEGKEHVVNLDINTRARSDLSATLSDIMNDKGYPVMEPPVESFGLAVGDSARFRFIDSGSKNDGDTAWEDSELAEASWASPDVDFGPLDEAPDASVLARMHRRLLNTSPRDLRESNELGFHELSVDAYSGVVMVQAVGVKVPFGKSFGQGMLTGLLTLGTVAVWEQSQTIIKISLVEPDSDRVVWANQLALGAVIRETEELQKHVGNLLESLPEPSQIEALAP